MMDLQDLRGQTPLFIAAALGHSDCVRCVHLQDTVFQATCENDLVCMYGCRLLLTNGADRTIPDIRGNLPLHMSSWWGHLSITFMLLDYMLPEQPSRLQARYVDSLLKAAVWRSKLKKCTILP